MMLVKQTRQKAIFVHAGYSRTTRGSDNARKKNKGERWKEKVRENIQW